MNSGPRVPCDVQIDHSEAENTPGMFLLDIDAAITENQSESACNCICLLDGDVVLSDSLQPSCSTCS